MNFANACCDVILNVLDEGYDAPDADLIRECLSGRYDENLVEKFVSEWDKLTDLERIELQTVCLHDWIQRDWLEKVGLI